MTRCKSACYVQVGRSTLRVQCCREEHHAGMHLAGDDSPIGFDWRGNSWGQSLAWRDEPANTDHTEGFAQKESRYVKLNKHPELLKVGDLVTTEFHRGAESIVRRLTAIERAPRQEYGSGFKASASGGYNTLEVKDVDAPWFLPAPEGALPIDPETFDKLKAERAEVETHAEELEGAPGVVAWCPQCGPEPLCDEDGCCSSCGATVGDVPDWRAWKARAERAGAGRKICIVFDGPPGPVAGRFVEVETPDGRSISAGSWRERDDGCWSLDLTAALADEPEKTPCSECGMTGPHKLQCSHRQAVPMKLLATLCSEKRGAE